MKNKLSGKVAVITGASGGIGYAMTKQLNYEGVRVYDLSLTIERHAEIFKAYAVDVNNTAEIEKILEEIYAENGHIDIFRNASKGNKRRCQKKF